MSDKSFIPAGSQVSVPAYNCVILTNGTAATVAGNRKSEGYPKPYSGPVNGKITIYKPGIVRMYSLDGVLWLCTHTIGANVRLDVSALPQGVYVVEIAGTGLRSFGKVRL
jgi:hypothetical protein